MVKTTNPPAPSVGSATTNAACRRNIVRRTFLGPILSYRVGQKIRPSALATAMMTAKVEAGVVVVPPSSESIALASEINARPTVVFRKSMAIG